MTDGSQRDQESILADVKRLAAEYYRVAGRPLGVTGELAEFEAADKLGLQLADAGWRAMTPPAR